MFEEIDRSLERWLRAEVPLPPGDAEISFDQPEKTWDARRSTPLVDLFLYSLSKSASRAETGSRVVPGENGGLARVRVVPVVEARYLVSVWGGGPGVEHELLGRVMNVLAANREIPDAHLSDALRAARPAPSLSLDPDTQTSFTHLWSGLGVPPRPAIQLLVYAPTGVARPNDVPDPPSAVRLGVGERPPAAAFAPRRRVFGRATAASGEEEGQQRARAVVDDSARTKDGPSKTVLDIGPSFRQTGAPDD